MSTLRKYLIAGLLVWLPIAATVAIVTLVVDVLDRTVLLLPPEYRPEALLGFSIPGFGVILAIGTLVLTGVLAANFFGRQLVSLWEAGLDRIPLVRNIYKAVKQISTTILSSEGKAFRKVVLVEYPRRDTWSIGFLTNEQVQLDCENLAESMAAVFIPTTPNPTSGYILMIPKEDIIELEMSVEEGFKFIISMGVIVPDGAIKGAISTTKVAQSLAGS